MGSYTLGFARYLHALSLAAQARAVRRHVRWVVADTVACVLAGLQDAQVKALGRRLPAGPVEPLTGIAHSPQDAALVLGFAAAAFELDEGHYATSGHPAAPVVAAALAESARLGVPLPDCLPAIFAGYEAGARLGAAAPLRPEIHGHGTWGTVGAAVACARLRGYDAEQLAAVIGLASSLSLATSSAAPRRGASVRSAWIGVSARSGLLACDLAESGVTPEPDAAGVIFGQILGSGFDGKALAPRADELPMIMGNFMKTESSCRETQGALAALDVILAGHAVNPASVRQITVRTFVSASLLDARQVSDFTAARFSIPAALAARLLWGRLQPDTFSTARLASEDFIALAGKVRVAVCPQAEAVLPAKRVCEVVIDIEAEECLSGRVEAIPGDAQCPLDEAALKAKFFGLVDPVMPGRAQGLWEEIISEAAS